MESEEIEYMPRKYFNCFKMLFVKKSIANILDACQK